MPDNVTIQLKPQQSVILEQHRKTMQEAQARIVELAYFIGADHDIGPGAQLQLPQDWDCKTLTFVVPSPPGTMTPEAFIELAKRKTKEPKS